MFLQQGGIEIREVRNESDVIYLESGNIGETRNVSGAMNAREDVADSGSGSGSG